MAGNACKLSALLAGYAEIGAEFERDIQGLSLDSRKTRPGDLFLACLGQQSRHGHAFIAEAIRAGAVAVAYELSDEVAAPEAPAGIPVFGVARLGQCAGIIAERFYGNPSRKLFTIGVTGTNGKTSVSQFIAQALSEGWPCGVIGTLGNGLYGQLEAGSHTTPDAISLHALLAAMVDERACHAVMEVSSHALEQGRVNGVAFDTAVFTNLSRDHLDYHGDMASYGRAKRRLFERPGLRHAVINADDPFGRELLQSLPAGVAAVGYTLAGGAEHEMSAQPVRSYDLSRINMVRGTVLHQGLDGMEMHIDSPWGALRFHSVLLGRFNAGNLLAAFAALMLAGVDLIDIPFKLHRLWPVPGRMEGYGGVQGLPLVVVDYAHTPDALQQVLQALREHCRGTLWVVFGCGGDRDRGKRPLMGEVAERHADRVVLTDDNPRSEDGQLIIEEIMAGMSRREAVEVIRDRALAIARVVKQAKESDVALVAGKGHEDYQIVGGEKRPFSDSRQVCDLLKEMAQ